MFRRYFLVCFRISQRDERTTFLGNSSSLHALKDQITNLGVVFDDAREGDAKEKLFITIYLKIFALLTNLESLHLDIDAKYPLSESILRDLLSIWNTSAILF